MAETWRLGDVEVTSGVWATMRDGCRLVADVYRPANATRPLPVALLRIPYDRRQSSETNYATPAWYARRGFIAVIQDTRGRFESEGEFVPFVHEAEDGYDTVEWAARLEGASGRVGTYGASYAGYIQLLTAAERPPSLGAICPAVAGSDLYRDWFYQGGAFNLAFAAWWAATLSIDAARRRRDDGAQQPLLRALSDSWRWYGSDAPSGLDPIADGTPFYREWLDHPERDEYWLRRSVQQLHDHIRVPALHVGGWYDVFNEGSVRNFVQLSRNDPEQRMLMGPWAHEPWGTTVGSQDFGPRAGGPVVDRAQAAFLRRHLDPGNGGGAGDARVRYYVLFDNRWQEADTWPPEGAREQAWFLHSDGTANTAGGDGRLVPEKPGAEPCDLYAYDPADPVPSLGGHSCCQEASAPMGVHDQALIEQRRDVLVFTGETLGADLLLAGPASVTLWVGATAPSADVVARLCLVGGGRSVNLAQGVWRSDVPLGPATMGTPVRVEIPLRNVAALVKEGSRLRLHVTAGSFPMYDVNPQSGAPASRARIQDRRPATHALHHDREHPSRLTLTVLDRSPADSVAPAL